MTAAFHRVCAERHEEYRIIRLRRGHDRRLIEHINRVEERLTLLEETVIYKRTHTNSRGRLLVWWAETKFVLGCRWDDFRCSL